MRRHDATMGEPIIDVRDLRKTFRVTERQEGLAATLRSFVRRQRRDVNAVAGITFRIEAGEVVGFLGPNGAGKTTTLKVLSGLLYPTAGEAHVLGFVPWRRENAYLQQMTLLMGNRTQLVWDIPAADSFRVLQEIYGAPDESFRRPVGDLTAYGTVTGRDEGRVTLKVDRQGAPERAARLVNELGENLADISVEDPPIEEVIDRVFSEERVGTAT